MAREPSRMKSLTLQMHEDEIAALDEMAVQRGVNRHRMMRSWIQREIERWRGEHA